MVTTNHSRPTLWRSLVTSAIFLLGLAFGAAPLAAQDATPAATSPALPPDAVVAGASLAEWSARSWQWSYSLPREINPYNDETGAFCGYGQSGPVFFLAGAQRSVDRSCVVPLGASIFVPIAGAECSTVEPPPWFGRDATELRRCAAAAVDSAEAAFDMTAMRLTVDGQAVPDLSAYRTDTPLFTLWLPEDNVLGVTDRVADAVADGYQAMLNPLTAGEHVVAFVTPGPQAVTITYRLTVVSGAYGQPSPEASPIASAAAGIAEWSVDVGGRSLHVACAGEDTGAPPVLVEQGGPQLEPGTSFVAAPGPDLAVALGTRFCAYDRAGTGQSEPDPMGVRTLTEAAADMNAVLASPDLACPCVVVGASLGGAIALVALAEDAAGFGGLVLLDAPYPGMVDEFLALAPAGSPEAAFFAAPYNTGENEERLDLTTGFRQVAAAAPPPGIPVVVVAHGAGNPPPCNGDPPCSAEFPVEEFEAAWQAGEAALAAALGGRLVVAEGTGHSIADENPELVIGLVAEVVAAVVDPRTWATPVASSAA